MAVSGDGEAEGAVVDGAIVGTKLDVAGAVGVDELGAGATTSWMINGGPLSKVTLIKMVCGDTSEGTTTFKRLP